MVNNRKMYGINPSERHQTKEPYNEWGILGAIKTSSWIRTSGLDWSTVMLW